MPRQTSISRRIPSRRRVCAAGLILSVAAAACLSPAATGAATDEISFRREIAPILQAKCVTCHSAEKAKGGYRLHTYADLLKPGKSKEPPVVLGQPARSKLQQLLVAEDDDDRMPQKDDPLPARQIELITRWIAQGAGFDGPDPTATLSSLVAPARNPDPPARYTRPVPVLALAFDSEGGTLAASGYHEVTLWNPTNGTLLRRIANVPQQVQALAYLPDGKGLVVAGGTPGRSGEIRLFATTNETASRVLATAGDLFLTLAFSPDGTQFIAGGADNSIRLFEVATGSETRRIEQHADWVMALAYSPDGKHFASASRDKTARLFDAKTGELEETYDGHGQAVFAIAFSPDGKQVFSAGRDREIHAWAAKDARRQFVTRGFDGEIVQLQVHGDELFSASADRTIRIHHLREKKAELTRTLSGHEDTIYALAIDPATHRLASGSYDGDVRVWNTETGALITHFLAAPGYRSDR